MGIKIIVDSGADLPKSLIEEYNIDVIPLYVILGEEEFLDGESIEPVDLFQNMRNGSHYKTSQVPVHNFQKIFGEYAKEGKKCIYLAFSSGISGTCQSAVLAKQEVLEEYPDFDLDIIDTKAASFGCGLVAYYVGKLAKEGKSKEEVLEAAKFFSEHMEHIFTVDDLEYLYRGGRVSKTAAFVGGILNVKPILDVEDGKLIPIEKVRGRKKVLKRIVEIMEERGVDLKNQVIGISHGDDLEAAEELEALIRERFACVDFVTTFVGGAIGAHSGPGTLALFFLNREIPEKYK